MLRNSFKFLSLTLAASLTVAPVSAIGWNSNFQCYDLTELAVATVGFVCVISYNYFSGKINTPKPKPVVPTVTNEEKQKFLNTLAKRTISDSEETFIKEIVQKLINSDYDKYFTFGFDVQQLSIKREKLSQLINNNTSTTLIHNQQKSSQADFKKEVNKLQTEFYDMLEQIETQLGLKTLIWSPENIPAPIGNNKKNVQS